MRRAIMADSESEWVTVVDVKRKRYEDRRLRKVLELDLHVHTGCARLAAGHCRLPPFGLFVFLAVQRALQRAAEEQRAAQEQKAAEEKATRAAEWIRRQRQKPSKVL